MINRKGRKERKGYVKTSEHTKITEEGRSLTAKVAEDAKGGRWDKSQRDHKGRINQK